MLRAAQRRFARGGQLFRRGRSRWAAAATFAALHAWAATALAHSNGQPSGGCNGCHGSGDFDISVKTAPSTLSPGDEVTVTVTISSPIGAVAGMYVSANAGTLSTIGGQGLALVNQGLTHTSPKSLQGGSVSFAFGWAAPGQPGAVRFEVSSVVANGNGKSSGDQADSGAFDFVYGCEPFTYFRDADGDGHGQDKNTMIHCVGTTPSGYAVAAGDCNDSDESIHPGATEVCNTVDDDCNGIVDDDAIPLDLYLDEDGDGYYSNAEYQMGVQKVGCVPAKGLAAYGGDCKPDDPAVNPGATEICNLIDDNCDGDIDERVRPRCGEGWCTREAPTCDPETCEPGEPRPEECNLLDDDCDGLVDEDDPCGPGMACVAAECVDAASVPGAKPGGSDDGGDGGCAVRDRPESTFALLWYAVSFIWIVRRRARRPR